MTRGQLAYHAKRPAGSGRGGLPEVGVGSFFRGMTNNSQEGQTLAVRASVPSENGGIDRGVSYH
jgi:hypothetical protein